MHSLQHLFSIFAMVAKIRTNERKKAGNWEIMQFVGRLFNTQRASVVVMRS